MEVHQQEHAAGEQGVEQAGKQHGIADVMHVKFVEAQHLAAAHQFVEGRAQRIVQGSMAVHALMKAGKEVMKMQAALGLDRHRLEEAVQ